MVHNAIYDTLFRPWILLFGYQSDSQQNLRADSDPARRTCSGKHSFDENELQDLEKIEFMYVEIINLSFDGSGAN